MPRSAATFRGSNDVARWSERRGGHVPNLLFRLVGRESFDHHDKDYHRRNYEHGPDVFSTTRVSCVFFSTGQAFYAEMHTPCAPLSFIAVRFTRVCVGMGLY